VVRSKTCVRDASGPSGPCHEVERLEEGHKGVQANQRARIALEHRLRPGRWVSHQCNPHTTWVARRGRMMWVKAGQRWRPGLSAWGQGRGRVGAQKGCFSIWEANWGGVGVKLVHSQVPHRCPSRPQFGWSECRSQGPGGCRWVASTCHTHRVFQNSPEDPPSRASLGPPHTVRCHVVKCQTPQPCPLGGPTAGVGWGDHLVEPQTTTKLTLESKVKFIRHKPRLLFGLPHPPPNTP
jgi:hypothetical protein